MSDAEQAAAPIGDRTNVRLDASHRRRLMFETFCYMSGGGIMLASAIVLLAGVVMRPEHQYMVINGVPVLLLPDWGASVVERMSKAWEVLVGMLMMLGGWTGITSLRGYFDARLGKTGNAK